MSCSKTLFGTGKKGKKEGQFQSALELWKTPVKKRLLSTKGGLGKRVTKLRPIGPTIFKKKALAFQKVRNRRLSCTLSPILETLRKLQSDIHLVETLDDLDIAIGALNRICWSL
jgi:hypothetical protein